MNGGITYKDLEGLKADRMERVGKHAAGCLLDGREWKQMPEVHRG
jgi:hypothetical protein